MLNCKPVMKYRARLIKKAFTHGAGRKDRIVLYLIDRLLDIHERIKYRKLFKYWKTLTSGDYEKSNTISKRA